MIWISHRGCSPLLENSREAFDRAVSLGFDVLETDLRVCGSGEVVLSHDGDLSRLWGDPRAISQLGVEEFRELRGPQGERPLTFAQFAERYGDRQWILDVKEESGVQVIDALARWAEEGTRRAFLEERVRFLFWSSRHEKLLKSWLPNAVCLPGERECWRAGLAVILGLGWIGGIEPNRCYALPPRVAGVALYRKRWVDAFHRRGARVLAFLPSDPASVACAEAAGVDEILVDGERSDSSA